MARHTGKFVFGRFEFPTKSAAMKHISSVASGAPVGTRLQGEDKECVKALIENRHPEAARKVGVGIRDVIICETDWGHRGFRLVRVDGVETDVSWKDCFHPPSALQNLRDALRTAVRPQIEAAKSLHFADATTASCAYSGTVIMRETSDVHHEGRDFAQLVDGFLREKGIRAEDMTFVGADGVQGATLDEKSSWIGAAFAAYHQENATLRVIHIDLHRRLKKGR